MGKYFEQFDWNQLSNLRPSKLVSVRRPTRRSWPLERVQAPAEKNGAEQSDFPFAFPDINKSKSFISLCRVSLNAGQSTTNCITRRMIVEMRCRLATWLMARIMNQSNVCSRSESVRAIFRMYLHLSRSTRQTHIQPQPFVMWHGEGIHHLGGNKYDFLSSSIPLCIMVFASEEKTFIFPCRRAVEIIRSIRHSQRQWIKVFRTLSHFPLTNTHAFGTRADRIFRGLSGRRLVYERQCFADCAIVRTLSRFLLNICSQAAFTSRRWRSSWSSSQSVFLALI